MEKIRKTDPMVIMKGSVQSPLNILLRESTYVTFRTRTVLNLQEIKTSKRDIKIQRMVSITKVPGDDYGFRHNPDSSQGIYMTLVIKSKCHIFAKNWIK